ncbi:MAG: hypothetical protein KAY50_04445 [Chitinophagaceae bacterium]|nr:hypothetical protein [Chitinophagaceae bacterium]
MKIKNIGGMSAENLQEEVEQGGRFVYYAYTISLIVLTFRKTSGVYLLKKEESAVAKGIGFTLLSCLFGWWGFPFGPKYTIESIRTNMKGGKDVTDEVMATVAGHILFREAEKENIGLS